MGNPPASASWVVGLQASVTTSGIEALECNGKVFFWVIWKPEGLLLCEELVLGGRTSRSQRPPYSKIINPSIIAEMLDLCWLWEKKWWALWFQLRRRLGRKIPGAQEFLVNIVRASLLKETNRCFIRNSSHLPLWVPGTDLGLSSLHSRLSHVTGPLLGSLYPFFNVVFIKFICRDCFHFAYEVVIWENELAEGLTGYFEVPELLVKTESGCCSDPCVCCLNHCLLMFAVTSTALREWSILPRHLSHKDDDWSCDPPILSRGGI